MTLSYRDQADLTKYFALGYMEKSTAGPTLERAWLYATESSVVESDKLTARITAEVRIAAKGEPHLDDLEIIGRVSRKLAMLSARNRKALELFHGDRGALCDAKASERRSDQVDKQGRLVALFEMTPAGRALAKRERLSGKAKQRESNAVLIEKIIERVDKATNDAKGGLHIGEVAVVAPTIGLAMRQALELKAAAEEAYTAASEHVAAERRPVASKPPILLREMRDDEL